MKSKILALVAAVSLAFSSATIAEPESLYLYLPNPVKEQSGIYQVHVENTAKRNDFQSVVPSSGAILEVFAPNERVLLDGTTLDDYFVFGAVFTNDGNFFTVQSTEAIHEFDGRVVRFNVVMGTTRVGKDGKTENYQVGTGNITFDKKHEGDAHVIDFEFNFFNGFEYLNSTHVQGQFLRPSDKPIIACKEDLVASPMPPEDYRFYCMAPIETFANS